MSKHKNSLPKSTELNIAFIHGWGMNPGAFTQIINELNVQLKSQFGDENSRFNVQNISLPGHGDKHDLIPEPYDLEQIAINIGAELAKNSIVIAWSLGGLVGQYLASQGHPNIIGLLTIASTPKFQMTPEWPGIKPQVLQMFMQQLTKNHNQTLTRFLAIQMMGVDNPKQLIKDITKAIGVYPAPNIEALSAGLTILQDADIRDKLQHIEVPTLRLYGRLDSLVPHDAVNQIQNLQPQSKSLVIKHASHAPFLTDAKVFCQHIVDFIASVAKVTN
ncbi:MAG: pimeloyl-[acyl-carrier protein] methyl ester esterase [Glaciecola sp.]|jgi:pimeloyl-[acyl-carrier protein] methyl ester esterase